MLFVVLLAIKLDYNEIIFKEKVGSVEALVTLLRVLYRDGLTGCGLWGGGYIKITNLR